VSATDWSHLKESYERDGYAIARNVLDEQLVGEAQSHVQWLIKKHPELRPEQFHNDLVKDDPFWVRLVRDSRLLDVAESFIGPNMALFASHYICKPPRTGQQVLWHQDGSYWPLDPMEVVSLWLAASDSTAENGCLRVIPGTHTLDLQELQQRDDVENVLSSGIDESHVCEADAVDLVLQAGDVSIHHPNVIHGSNENRSDQWRMGLTIRYIPTSTRILTDLHSLLLRGEAIAGINEYLPDPVFVDGQHMPFRGDEAFRKNGNASE